MCVEELLTRKNLSPTIVKGFVSTVPLLSVFVSLAQSRSGWVPPKTVLGSVGIDSLLVIVTTNATH